ncbi:MAG: hypothetical protein IT256_03810, partial [Chitinophagaceae bacterium]|nr:hypothetical protein [Chitinophagaceae bacterium]
MNNRKYFFLSVVSIVLWTTSFFYYLQSQKNNTPSNLVQLVQQDIVQQQQQIAKLIADKKTLNNIWNDSITVKQVHELAAKDFIIQYYKNGELAYWNQNNFPIEEHSFSSKWKTFKEDGKVFVYKSIGNAAHPGKRINFIIPVFIHYDIQNEYLKSHFVASDLIPKTSLVSLEQLANATLIKDENGNAQFYLRILDAELGPFKPNIWLRLLVGLALISTILAFQFLSIFLSKKYSPYLGVGLVAFLLTIAQLARYFFGLPFDLQNLDVFSPLIFASNKLLSSLGHLF